MESSHSNNDVQQNDAFVKLSNNLNVIIDGLDTTALIDAGADYSVLSGKLSCCLRKMMTSWDSQPIRTTASHPIIPTERYTACVEIHGKTTPVKLIVQQDCSKELILGIDFLCEYSAIIDLNKNLLTLRKPIPLPED